MKEILHELCPTGKVVGVVGIPAHKLGPIHAVRHVGHLLDPNRPVVVNHCDFTCCWNWNHFKQFVYETDCTGTIPAYKGFHPHLLAPPNYAYIQEAIGNASASDYAWASDIQEKQPYTDNRMEEFAL